MHWLSRLPRRRGNSLRSCLSGDHAEELDGHAALDSPDAAYRRKDGRFQVRLSAHVHAEGVPRALEWMAPDNVDHGRPFLHPTFASMGRGLSQA